MRITITIDCDIPSQPSQDVPFQPVVNVPDISKIHQRTGRVKHQVYPLDGHENGWHCACGQYFTVESGYAWCPNDPNNPKNISH